MRAAAAALIGLLAAGPAAVLPAGAPARAQSLCGARGEILARLAQRVGEMPVALGVAGEGARIVELVATPSGSTWTLLVTLPSGMTCVLAAGEHWQAVGPNAPGEAS